MTSNASKLGYLFYLNLIKLRDERQSNVAFDLDAVAMRLLELIALDSLNLHPLTASESIKIKSLGTAPTVRRNINLLMELGLIEQFFIGTNKRTKYMKPSKLAIDYLGSVGQSMLKAVAV